ncbi:MAG: DUF4382 domain-containing protein [Candidatus Micrarchaeaceae archaeon]
MQRFIYYAVHYINMSKYLETKNRILDLLEKKKMTLSDISSELNLAPSTVSQHLRELEEKGFISEVDNPYVRKWKYYQANKPAYGREVSYNTSKMDKRMLLGVAAAAAMIILGITFFIFSAQSVGPSISLSPGSSIPIGSTIFTISDSPGFADITGVYVNISGAMIHSETTGKWYRLPIAAKTYNLVELRNTSAILSGVALKSGVYNEIVLDVQSATATLNGTNQSVFIPSGKLIILGKFNISNSTTNWVNIDFNLAKSLHITGNGKVVLLPVLTTELRQGAELDVGQNLNIGIRSFGLLKAHEICGMNESGKMIANFSIPQNRSIEIAKGHAVIVGLRSMPMIVRGKGVIWISLGNVVNASSINEVANGRMISINGTAGCYVEGGALNCESNASPGSNAAAIIASRLNISCCRGLVVPPATANVSNRLGPAWNISKNSTVINASIELALVKTVDASATPSAFACTTNSDCVLVPITRCQNGVLGQQVAMNSAYARLYMSFYNIWASRPPICPMFIVESTSAPECIANQCVLIYSRPAMPTSIS